MTELELLQRVESLLRTSGKPMVVREIQADLSAMGIEVSRSGLNSLLYRHNKIRLAMDSNYRWTCRQTVASETPTAATPAAANDIPPPAFPRVEDHAQAATARAPDREQEQIIHAPCDARLVVEAGPGFGKTEVACARVAKLLTDVDPTEILVLSFTRTAVREMRNRVRQLSITHEGARSVSIRTLDSFNAELRRVVSQAPLRGYDISVQEVVNALEDEEHPLHDTARQELQQFRHILVDEAQDLVGARATLVALLLQRSGAGWTVFHDPAQAIYGWAESGDRNAQEVDGGTILEQLQERGQLYDTRRLETLHRTSNRELASLQVRLRKIVLKGKYKSRADEVRKVLQEAASSPLDRDGLVARLKALSGPSADRTLMLLRTRAEALQLSHDLAEAGIRHRLRMGNMPQVIAPWVAACLNHIRKPKLGEKDFATAWAHVSKAWPRLTAGWDIDRAWNTLLRASHSGRTVETARIADAIAYRTRTEELFSKEVGAGGPIIGTIHGSKGRESERVMAIFPTQGRDREDTDEEARVLYVAATRAREHLELIPADSHGTGYIDGRAWKGLKGPRYLLEMGRENDVDPLASCGTVGADAAAQQAALASYNGSMIPVAVGARKLGDQWRWLMLPNNRDRLVGARADQAGLVSDLPLGALTPEAAQAFAAVARQRKAPGPKGYLFGLYWLDLTTVAVRADEPSLTHIPAKPWRETRLWLAPVIMGFGLGQTKVTR